MTGQELKQLRLEMKFAPRDMRCVLGLARRTYQDYESDRRSIPADIAVRIREVHRRDREFMAGLPARIHAALEKEFPGGMIPSFQTAKEEEE